MMPCSLLYRSWRVCMCSSARPFPHPKSCYRGRPFEVFFVLVLFYFVSFSCSRSSSGILVCCLCTIPVFLLFPSASVCVSTLLPSSASIVCATTGHQSISHQCHRAFFFFFPSVTVRYINDLCKGCRCVELDCWDGDEGEPVIYHGYTLTGRIRFADVIQVCSSALFVFSLVLPRGPPPPPSLCGMIDNRILPASKKMAFFSR